MPELNAIIRNYRQDKLNPRRARNAAAELGNRVHDGTPIDTGVARGGWTVESDINVAGDVYEYINRIKYIEALEHGHSDQAPNGMLKINVRNWQSIVDWAFR